MRRLLLVTYAHDRLAKPALLIELAIGVKRLAHPVANAVCREMSAVSRRAGNNQSSIMRTFGRHRLAI